MKTLKQHIEDAQELGLIPYIATSENYAAHLDTSLFGDNVMFKLMERPEDKKFHQAYVFANFLGFGGTGVEMPGWVYLDCVLMQTAVVGFAVHKDQLPDMIVEKFRAHPTIYFDDLDYVPISGQTAGLGIDRQTLVGFSLFSLRKYFTGRQFPALGLLTKAAGLYTQKAEDRKKFIGISQYNNPALKIHGRFCEKMYIQTPMVPLHPLTDLTMIYAMEIEFDDTRLFAPSAKDDDTDYDFLLKADDMSAKQEIEKNIAEGQKYIIAPPFQIRKDGGIYLPIKVERLKQG